MSDTATVEAEATTVETSGEGGGEGTNEGESKRQAKYINFPNGSELWSRLESEATAQNKTPRQLLFEMLAGRYGIEVPAAAVAAPRRKYASDEERAQAQKQQRKDRNELIKQLLQEHAAKQAALAAQQAQPVGAAA